MSDDLLLNLHPSMPVLELADAFHHCAAPDDPEHLEAVRSTLLMAGEHLSERDAVGQWHAFEAQRFWSQVNFLPRRELERVLITLLGFFGWMTLLGLVDLQVGLTLLDDLHAINFPSSIVDQMYNESRSSLLRAEEADLAAEDLPRLN